MNASRWIALAASPSFALLALASLVQGADPAAVLCAAAGGAPFGGMTVMYALMSLFHATPWLRLIDSKSEADSR